MAVFLLLLFLIDASKLLARDCGIGIICVSANFCFVSKRLGFPKKSTCMESIELVSSDKTEAKLITHAFHKQVDRTLPCSFFSSMGACDGR